MGRRGIFPLYLLDRANLIGNQIEYLILSYHDQGREARLCLRQAHILNETAKEKLSLSGKTPMVHPIFVQEVGSFNLETTPGKPWGIGSRDLLDVEANMKWRSV